MIDDLWRLKILAYLHDPPDKALEIRGHESRTIRYLGRLLPDEPSKRGLKRDTSLPDVISAAAERLAFPKPGALVVNWTEDRVDGRPFAVHPLSGRPIGLPPLKALRAHQDEVEAALDGVVEIETHEQAFLSLWRSLSEQLSIESPAWAAFPADTRIPDHSIWSHMDTAAALVRGYRNDAGEQDRPAFLHMTLGPVQDFIAAARTTRDLWTGSYLLSYLAWNAMRPVVQACGPDAIIYPALRGQPLVDRWLGGKGVDVGANPNDRRLRMPSLPNKFLALVPTSRANDLRAAAERSSRDALCRIAQRVRDLLAEEMAVDEGSLEGWDEQTEKLLECRGVVLAWPEVPSARILEDFLDKMKRLIGGDAVERIRRVRDAAETVPAEDRDERSRLVTGSLWPLLYEATAKLLAARKEVRSFDVWSGDSREKDTIDGLREQMGPKSREHESFWNGLAQQQPRGVVARLRANERLSAVNLVKRYAWDAYFQAELGIDRVEYPSVASIATAAWKRRLLEGEPHQVDELRAGIGDLVESVDGSPSANLDFREWIQKLDGQWLYEESYADRRADKEGCPSRALDLREKALGVPKLGNDEEIPFTSRALDLREKALGALRDFLKTARKQFGTPPRYFAVIAFDGDRMGKWISGEMGPLLREVLHPKVRAYFEERGSRLLDERRPLGPALHAAIGEALGNFSLEIAPDLVEEGRLGKLVYAGGDDVLALVPVDRALARAGALRAAYSGWAGENGNATLGEGFYRTEEGRELLVMGSTATASAGIVIAHYLQPLRQVVAEAQSACKRAKEVYGRDALCLRILKRSGEPLATGARWRSGNAGFDLVGTIHAIREAMESEKLSPRFAYRVREEVGAIAGTDAPVEMIEGLVRRAFKRQSNFGPGDGEGAKALLERIEGLLQHCRGNEGRGPAVAFEDFAAWLLAAAFLARGGRER